MINTLFNNFLKNSFVISIDNNQLKYFYEMCDYIGIQHPILFKGHTEYKICSDFKNLNKCSRQQNCTNSHRDIIKIAKENDWDYVTIFEDDAFPTEKFSEYFYKIINNVQNIDFNILALGHIFNTTSCDVDELFSKTLSHTVDKDNLMTFFTTITRDCFYGSHAYIIRKQFYDIAIENLSYIFAADSALIANNDKCYICKYPLFVQRDVNKKVYGKIHRNDSYHTNCLKKFKVLY